MADGSKTVTKEVNASLKAAKDAIKRTEYKEALKHCKNVIKNDKTNYHAFVFIGFCAKEMEQFNQSMAAYKKAIENSPEEVLAWQGLCNLYEAVPNEDWKEDCVQGYEKLISTSKNDMPKWKELLMKIIPLQLSLEMTSEAAQNLKDLEGITSEPSEDLLVLWKKCLEQIESKVQKSELSEELQNQMENAFQSILEYSRVLGMCTEQTQGNHLIFLKNLLKKNHGQKNAGFFEKQLLVKGESLLEQYPNNVFALELVVKITMEQSFDDISTTSYLQQLMKLDESQPLSVIASAYLSAQNGSWANTLSSLKGIESIMNKDYIPLYWLLMSKALFHLHETNLALMYAKKGELNLQNCFTETGIVVYAKAFILAKAAVLIETKKFEEAKEILVELVNEDSGNIEALHKLGITYAQLGENDAASKICSRMLEINANFHGSLVVNALISINEQKLYDAELRLQGAIELKDDIAQYHFLLGKVYWDLRKDDEIYAKKAHTCFLKAAKLDPNDSTVFVALGNFYREIHVDLKKAMKCFQKAVSLNEFNEEACLAYGDVAVDLEDQEIAINIYEKTTRNFGPGRVKIAWLRLGVLLTKRGSPDKAVKCFQGAIRCDPTDRLLWECLGDAFIARGSYIPAMKSFQRASEIDPSEVYCRYKIAVIKQSICLYPDAIREFEKVLAIQNDYIPAIKGMADCYLKLEYESIAENFDGRAVDHARNALIAASRAIGIAMDLCCFWKIIGDACFALNVIAEEKLNIDIPDSIVPIVGLKIQENQSRKSILLDLSRRCYAVIIKLDESSAEAWHDLALSSFHYGMSVDGESSKATVQQSIQFIRKAIDLEPANPIMWNTLGVISASQDIANPELSQHAFIKALQLDPQSAEAWTNLGSLYLKYDKIKVAHEAFKKAQDADPSYAPAWVGQASIAEIIGDQEAMDLFRHSSELGSNAEGFLSYAKWVCFELRSFYDRRKCNSWKPDDLNLPQTVRKAIANSSVCVQQCADRFSGNSCAFNLSGILLEHQKLYKPAKIAFERSLELLSSNEIDKRNMVQSNIARVLRLSGQYKDAAEAYLKIQPLIQFNDVTGLAVSYFLSGELQKSFNSYEQALNLADDEMDKSEILASMGMVAYVNGNVQLAKNFLMQSSQTESASEQALSALSALGLLSKDHTLTNAALAEIKKHPNFRTEPVERSYAYLISAMHLLQGNIAEAKRCIQKVIKRYPTSSKLWNRLATFIFKASPALPLEAAGRCAIISAIHQPTEALCAFLVSGNDLLSKMCSLMVTSAAALGSQTFAMTSSDDDNDVTYLHFAQTAVHRNPEVPENWALLAAAILARSIRTSNESCGLTAVSVARVALLKAEENLTRLEEALTTTVSNQLMPKIKIASSLRVYVIKILIWAYLHNGSYDIALLLCDNAMTEYEGEPAILDYLLYLKVISEILIKDKDGQDIAELLAAAKLLCDSGNEGSIWKYQVLGNLCLKLGLPLVAEWSIHKCLQLAAHSGLQKFQLISLIQLALMSICCFSKDRTEKWIHLASEAVTEAAKLSPENCLVDILKVNLYHVKGDAKNAKKTLERLKSSAVHTYAHVINTWDALYCTGEQKTGEADSHKAQD